MNVLPPNYSDTHEIDTIPPSPFDRQYAFYLRKSETT